MLNEKKNSENLKERESRIKSLVGLTSLVFVFIAVSFVKETPSASLDQSSVAVTAPRSLASIQSSRDLALDTSWQKNLATHLAELPSVPSGKSGRPANPIEALVFGELKGLYSMKVKDDKITAMLLKSRESGDAPQFLGNEEAFLQKNKELFWVSFAKISVKERTSEKSVITLMDESQKAIGQAEFSWGQAGRLLSLKIEKL